MRLGESSDAERSIETEGGVVELRESKGLRGCSEAKGGLVELREFRGLRLSSEARRYSETKRGVVRITMV